MHQLDCVSYSSVFKGLVHPVMVMFSDVVYVLSNATVYITVVQFYARVFVLYV